ncbi:MAG: exodeoxyribonuclease V subunit gamma [Firmicutes bacterium]|nr:exodeoxyribonuclease V subunit gamma [Bacillota bacterium]
MPLTIITGGAGSGKSARLYEQMTKNLAENPDFRAILIVPEQFSFAAEKTLLSSLGGLGINRMEVLTFSRLLKRYVPQNNRLLPSGKMMLIQKAAREAQENNVFYRSSSRTGFIDELSDLFSELKRYGISPEDFEGLHIENAHTSKKLSSINEIYKSYSESISNGFSDSDDEMGIFADIAENSDLFSNTFFYIDDYSDFMPTHFKVIEAFLKRSKGVFMTLCIDNALSYDLFKPVIKTKNRLISICEKIGVPYNTLSLPGDCDYINAKDIRHLVKNWDEKPSFSGKSKNISIFNSLDMYSEAEHTAAKIISLVRDTGLRFRDIGIICGDIKQYLHILTSVFSDFNIPFFTDEKLSVSMHPVAKTVLALFDILKENWSYQAVFDYLRTGYIYIKDGDTISAISQEDIDLLENYVLTYGIKGKKAWFSKWVYAGGTAFDEVTENRMQEEFDLDRLNELRIIIISPFLHFLENKGRTARAIAEAVYGFMCDINLYDGLMAECAAFDALGKRNEAEQFKQVWNFVIETLDQLVAVSKEGAISREEFANRFLCGLAKCEIAIIPSGLDRVSLGTVTRNSPSRVKALFIIGALDGLFPKVSDGGNILSDFDRAQISSALKKHDKELAPDNRGRVMLENFKFYRTFTTATEKLFISFPSSDHEGNAVNPAHFVSEIAEMFDLKIEENIITPPDACELLSSPKRGFYYMLRKLSEYYKEKPEKLWHTVYEWYAKNPEYCEKLDILKAAASYKKLQPALSRKKAELLYGKNKKYSITALEKYEKCPFSYYLERGLRLTEQKENKIQASHIGSLIHVAIYEFCHAVEDGAMTLAEIHRRWTDLTDIEAKRLIHSVMEKISEKVLKNAKSDTERLSYLLLRCEITLENSVRAIRQSLSMGEYAAICYEKEFETVIDWKGDKITLTGKIDRIDIMEQLAENRLNIRIVDYKSGKKDFSVSAICDKVDMQLVMYAIAAEDLAKSGLLTENETLNPQISAVLYSKASDADNINITLNQEELAKGVPKKTQKMDGLFILDEEDGKLSAESLYSMDASLNESQKSEFLNIKITKDGNLYKNSPVASRREFEIMKKYIKKSAVFADKEIKSGNISIKPYCQGSMTPCDYCPFGEICMFDKKHDGYRMAINAENAFEYMEKEVD